MDIVQQIRDKGLKATPARQLVYGELTRSHMAYSHAELEALFIDMDRVTLYRILKDFEDAGLVHKVFDTQGSTRFAICHHTCPGKHHAENHVHFNCNDCGKMFCLQAVQTPEINIPSGFKVAGMHTLIYGSCEKCNQQRETNSTENKIEVTIG